MKSRHSRLTTVLRGLLPLCCAAVALSLLPRQVQAQADSLFHVSLRGWAERAWLGIIDLNHSQGGRVSERGILKRFHEGIDDKYFMDRLTAAFPLMSSYEWYRRDSGVRWRTGSITKRDLIMYGEFKTKVPVGSRWAIGVRFDKVDEPEAQRSVFRVAVHREFAPSLTGYARLHLDAEKPGSDLELGVDWHHQTGLEVDFSMAVLDYANDIIYLNFDAVSQSLADSTLEYERQPLIARLGIAYPVSSRVRVEAYGGYMRPSSILAYDGRIETDGFRQAERFAFGAVMVEWAPLTKVLAGAFLTTIRARSEREPLSPSAPVAAYGLTERTTQFALFGVAQISRRWSADGWLLRTWRPEHRLFPNLEQPDVEFDMRSWNAQALLTYTAVTGFTTDLGVGWNRGIVTSGAGQVPANGTLGGIQYRIRYDVGWRSPQFSFLVGAATDVDAEGEGGMSFGGARGRFVLYW